MLKRILQKIHPDTVILEYAPHNISVVNDLKFSHERWAEEMFKRSYTIADFKQINNVIPINYLKYYATLFKQIGFYPKLNHFNFIGHYSNENKSDLSDMNSVIKRHYYTANTKSDLSTLSLNYLDSIISICQKKEIEIILINTPVHTNYKQLIPTIISSKFNSLSHNYTKKGILVIDNNNYPDSLFFNSDHLNAQGANEFSKNFITLMRKNLPKHSN